MSVLAATAPLHTYEIGVVPQFIPFEYSADRRHSLACQRSRETAAFNETSKRNFTMTMRALTLDEVFAVSGGRSPYYSDPMRDNPFTVTTFDKSADEAGSNQAKIDAAIREIENHPGNYSCSEQNGPSVAAICRPGEQTSSTMTKPPNYAVCTDGSLVSFYGSASSNVRCPMPG